MRGWWLYVCRGLRGPVALWQGWLCLHPSLGRQGKSHTHKQWSVWVTL